MQQNQSAQVQSQNARNFLSDVGNFFKGLNPFSQNVQASENMFNAVNAEMMSKAVGAPPGSSAYSIASNPTLIDSIDNLLTGKVDYARTLETLQKEQLYQAEQNKINREWQQYMAEHSHQMEADDLRAIGLNPALTLTSGGANAYNASSVSSPGAREFKSGEGFRALMSLVMGLVSLSVNNARKVDAMNNLVDMNNSKLNVLQEHFANQDAVSAFKSDALSNHWINQDKISSANGFNISKHYQYKDHLDYDKFRYNQSKGFRG